jgi:OOP family OmpA-OmpF porin
MPVKAVCIFENPGWFGIFEDMFQRQSIRCFFYLLLLFAPGYSLAQKSPQNLVPNGSFETFRKKNNNLITNAIPWKNFNTVDYYKEPFKNDTSRFKGAHAGKAYCGLRFQKGYKEFPYVKLQQPLKAGVSYKFEMYIRLSYWSNVSLKSFGVHIGQNPYKIGEKLDSTNFINLYNRKGLSDNSAWIRVGGTFVAKGKEKFITIGNYSEKVKKDFVKLNPYKIEFIKSEAYYFLDDVSLQEGFDPKTGNILQEPIVYYHDTVFKPGVKFDVGTPVLLNNVFFETGESIFGYESLTQLDKFVAYLEDHPDAEIQIVGHTDDKVRKSQKIAKARAQAVCEYLISKDVLNKLYFKGLGSSIPIAPNDTEEGRAKNNRVEFIILQE